jgi:uncharacterized repeat protein (TIGR03803 family)
VKTNTNSSKWSWIQLDECQAARTAMLLLLLLCLGVDSGAAQTYTTLHYFDKNLAEGRHPAAGLVLSGTKLYGTTWVGGVSGLGTVFSINTDGSDYTVLKDFTEIDGILPEAGLLLSGTTLYGTTSAGGSNSNGTLFEVNTDGSGFAVLKHFSGGDGANPHAGLVLSGDTLYGTTRNGGSFGHGTVFKLNTNGGNFTLLRSFDNQTDGHEPWGDLVISGSTLYGTTLTSVFKVGTDGNDFAVLKWFTSWSDGAQPESTLVLSGTTLYGTTLAGGTNGGGTVFKVNTDGSGFAVLKSLGASDGSAPRTGLALAGSILYGATSAGGTNEAGTVFKLNTDGSDFAVLKFFTGADGSGPFAPLVLPGSTLYGTAGSGGIRDSGVVFSLSLAPIIAMPPQSQTAEVGSTVHFRTLATGFQPLRYQWFFNGTDVVSDATTDCQLVLTDIQFSQSGAYTVFITNATGAVTSSPAMLNVIQAIEHWPVACLKLLGKTGSLLNVDYASSISPPPNWTTLGSVNLTSTSQYWFDLTLPLPPQRFYRAWQTGTPGVLPSLDLHMVPAITLTGNIGHFVRVDYINRFGPIDAWVTLDTVTLTNTSQLYFDVSAWRQPQRLYRLVQVP